MNQGLKAAENQGPEKLYYLRTICSLLLREFVLFTGIIFLTLRVDRRPHLLFFRSSGKGLLEWTGEVGSGVQRDGLFAAASIFFRTCASSLVWWPC